MRRLGVLCENKGDLSFLKDVERKENYKYLRCFKQAENNFNIYIFTNFYESKGKLLEHWNELNNDIAFYFQNKITKDIERWNIYIVFFVAEKVESNFKYVIEQNKYCARKIVMDSFNDNYESDSVRAEIEEKLFDIRINTVEKNEFKTEETNVKDCIIKEDRRLFDLVNKKEIDLDLVVNKYLGVSVKDLVSRYRKQSIDKIL